MFIDNINRNNKIYDIIKVFTTKHINIKFFNNSRTCFYKNDKIFKQITLRKF